MKSALTLKSFVLLCSTLVILVNILANALPFFGNTTGEISNRYATLFTPASVTFSIWGLIYLLSVLFTMRFLTYDITHYPRSSFIIASSYGGLAIANITWLLLWHSNNIIASTIVLFVALFFALRLALHYKTLSNKANSLEKTFFTIYAAWLSVASIANVAIMFVAIDFTLPFSPVIWTIVVLIIATILAILSQNALHSRAFPAVILWAFFGITIRHTANAENNEPIIFITTLVLMGVLLIALFVFPKEKLTKAS